MTGIPWRSHLCGSGFGQKGSTLYIGKGTSFDEALVATPSVCAFAGSPKPVVRAKMPTITNAPAVPLQICIALPLSSDQIGRSMARSLFFGARDVNF